MPSSAELFRKYDFTESREYALSGSFFSLDVNNLVNERVIGRRHDSILLRISFKKKLEN